MPRDVERDTDKKVEQAKNTLAGDLWQSAKYSMVQESYNGLAQIGNSMGASIKERHLVDKPKAAADTEHQVAQEVGAVMGKAPLVMAAYGLSGYGMRKFIDSVGLPASSEASLARLSLSAATVGGLTSETEGRNLPYERAKMAALGGLSIYALGKTQEKLLGASGLLESASTSVLSSIGRHAGILGINTTVGAGGAAILAEADSLATNHRHIDKEGLERSIGTGLALSLAVGAAFKPKFGNKPVEVYSTGNESPSQVFKFNDPMQVPELGERRVDPNFVLPARPHE